MPTHILQQVPVNSVYYDMPALPLIIQRGERAVGSSTLSAQKGMNIPSMSFTVGRSDRCPRGGGMNLPAIFLTEDPWAILV